MHIKSTLSKGSMKVTRDADREKARLSAYTNAMKNACVKKGGTR
jgi:hypothetical protein